MTCVFCTKNFEVDPDRRMCQKCSLFSGCKKIKCPYCSYEMPDDQQVGQTMKKWGRALRGLWGK